MGARILDTTTALIIAEKRAFELLRSEVCQIWLDQQHLLTFLEVNALSGPLRRNARILDELDVTLAFASFATEMNFVRPVITNESVEIG